VSRAKSSRLWLFRVEAIRHSRMALRIALAGVHRARRSYQPRERRVCCGELVQIDGSAHAWFEERGPRCTLLVYIDDTAE